MPKNWCLQTVVLGKTPESLLDGKEIKPVNLKGNQPWILVGRTGAEAEAPVFWSSDRHSQLIGKIPDIRKDWGQEEKRASEDEVAGWHHWCNWHEFGRTSGDGEGQGGHGVAKSWTWLGNSTTTATSLGPDFSHIFLADFLEIMLEFCLTSHHIFISQLIWEGKCIILTTLVLSGCIPLYFWK